MAGTRGAFRTVLIVASVTIAISACAGNAAQPASQPPPASITASPATPAPASAPASPAQPSVAVPPDVTLVRLSAAYSPAAVHLNTGQQFLVTVSPDVQATQDGIPDHCAVGATMPAGDGLLNARCTADGVLYTAMSAGTATLSASVGPHCGQGAMCPQWRTRPTLTVMIH